MKKIVVFVLLICCLFTTMLVKVEKNPLFEISGVEKVCFVSGKNYACEGISSVQCGSKFFNFCSLETAKERLEDLKKNMEGLQFYFEEVSLQEVASALKFEVVMLDKLENMTVYCGYTPYYQDCVYLNNKKINVQIAEQNGKIVAGFPMILTGY